MIWVITFCYVFSIIVTGLAYHINRVAKVSGEYKYTCPRILVLLAFLIVFVPGFNIILAFIFLFAHIIPYYSDNPVELDKFPKFVRWILDDAGPKIDIKENENV